MAFSAAIYASYLPSLLLSRNRSDSLKIGELTLYLHSKLGPATEFPEVTITRNCTQRMHACALIRVATRYSRSTEVHFSVGYVAGLLL